MKTTRLEAFSDGVLAIVITIMVLELKIPHEPTLLALERLWPVFSSYVLSFIYIGIYWNNHHHVMAASDSVTGGVLWANLHLLFWLSLLPFSTAWMGENHFGFWPTTVYGLDLLACAISFYILERSLIGAQGKRGTLARAVGWDYKGKLSPFAYVLGIALTWVVGPWAGIAVFAAVAALWIVPDPRIEKVVAKEEGSKPEAQREI
jgi:uncharacterized membrane protein